jgi:hypothetical protein
VEEYEAVEKWKNLRRWRDERKKERKKERKNCVGK